MVAPFALDPPSSDATGRPHRRSRPSRPRGVRARALRLATCLLLASATGGVALPGPALATGQVGEPAANFTKTDATGVVHTLDQYRGKVVVLFVMGWG